MKFSTNAASICILLAAAAAGAGEQQQTRIEIAIEDDSNGAQSFIFDSQDAGFNLGSMLPGESRSVTDRSGNTADVRRTEHGFELDFKGRTVELPAVIGDDGTHGKHEVEVLAHGDTAQMTKEISIIKSGAADGITIISGGQIDAATRERIAGVLNDAGHRGEVTYVDGGVHDGENQVMDKREVRIVRKLADETN